jgi:hypothetical protein
VRKLQEEESVATANDAETKREWEDIYLGEFVDHLLVFGSIIPHGYESSPTCRPWSNREACARLMV